MADFIVQSDCIVLNPETGYQVITEQNDITVDEVTAVVTQSETLLNSFIVEGTADFFVLDQEMFLDFGTGSGGGAGIADAPKNSNVYGRRNGAWVTVDVTGSEPDAYLYTQVNILNDFKQDGLGFGIDPKDQFTTINYLIDKGILKNLGNGDIVPNGPVFMLTPPMPTGLRASKGLVSTQLTWDSPINKYSNHGYTEVWRSPVAVNTPQTKLSNANSHTGYDDTTAVPSIAYKYWIRFVSSTGVVGPYDTVNGTEAQAFTNPANILELLQGQISMSQLDQDLREPIELITATDGIIFQQQQLADSILNETSNRVSALNAETAARIAAIEEEIGEREAGITSVTEEIQNINTDLKSRIDYMTSVTNGSFDTKYDWQFENDEEGWTTTGGSPVLSGGRLRPPFSTNTQSTSPALSFAGVDYKEVRARIRRVGTPLWDGTLFFTTSLDSDWTTATFINIPEPEFFNGYVTVAWDLALINAWTINTITGIRIQTSVVSDATNYFELDWVAIGKIAPGASVAFVKQEVSSQTSAIAAEAALRETLAAQIRGSYDGTDITSVSTGLLYNERVARAAADNALSSQLALLTAGTSNQFDQAKIWYFDLSIEGWTGFPSAPTIENPGWIRPASHASDPRVMSPTGLAIDAVKYPQVRVRVRKNGTPTWQGDLFWRKASDGAFFGGQAIIAPEPAWDSNGIGLLTFDPPWAALITIDQIRLDLTNDQDASNWIEIDWIAVGRPSPGASSAELAAELLARTNADSALASSITSLTTTVSGKASQSSVDSVTSRVTIAEGSITSQGTKVTQLDSQMFTNLINDNPSLIITNPVANVPDGWSPWDMTGVTRYTGTYAYSGGNAVQMICTSGANTGIQFICNSARVNNHEFVDVELIFTVTAGVTLSGAGLLFDWFNQSTNFRTTVPLKDILPTFELNKKYTIKYRLRRPPAFTGTFGNYQMWLMGNYIELGASSNHTIIYDSIKTTGADASASAIQILDSRVTSAEGVNTSQASLLTSLKASLAQNGNALNVSVWVPGTTGNQGTDNDTWTAVQNSAGSSNTIINAPGPFDMPEILWQSSAGSDNTQGSGGFDANIAADKLSTARGAVFYAFIKHDGPAAGSHPGTIFFGPAPGDVTNLSNVVDTNPYFGNWNLDSLMYMNEWYLAYGVVQPLGSTSPNSNTGGLYRLSTGERVGSFDEFRAHTTFGNTNGTWRSYHYYTNQVGRKVWWARPTIIPADSAPSPYEIMAQDKRLPATATALANLTATVTDTVNGLAATTARTAFLEANVPSSGGNLIPYDTEFQDVQVVNINWAFATRDLAGNSWIPFGLHQIGYTSPGQTEGSFEMYSGPIPVSGGKRYGFSAYVAAHRAEIFVRALFYDVNNNSIGAADGNIYYPGGAPGGQYLTDWRISGVISWAPNGTVYCRFVVRGNRQASQSDPYIWMCRPMVTEVNTTQTALPQWQPSAGGAIARIAAEETARATADSANATNITNVTTTVNGHTSTIAVQQSSIDGISAQYMVKLDVNGYVAGYGLYNSAGTSSFIINADKFAIGRPGATGIFPFIVDTVNNRVAMDGAYIKNASIGNAQISSLNASKIIAGTITTDKLVVGAATAAASFYTTHSNIGASGSIWQRTDTLGSFTGTGAKVTITVSAFVMCYGLNSVSSGVLTMYLRAGGVDKLASVMYDGKSTYNEPGLGQILRFTATILYQEAFPAGFRTYELYTKVQLNTGSNGSFVVGTSVVIQENKV